MAREWGPWTAIKLDALSKYLHGFTRASKKARRTLYLDLFAGAPNNVERGTGRQIHGSARRALEVHPPFDKLVFCELAERDAADLDADLRREYPGRNFEVLPGDCNEKLPAYLQRLSNGWRWAPTFAFLDQFSAEIRWDTIAFLADYKRARTKVEQWMYFGDSFVPRGLRGLDGRENTDYAQRVDAMFGDDRWRMIQAAREDNELDGHQARAELVNLMRWRLEQDLGYTTTLSLEVKNSRGAVLYTMIFATDHDVGERIMENIFEGAEQDLKRMIRTSKEEHRRRQLEDEAAGTLFLATELVQIKDDAGRLRKPIDPPVPPWTYHRLWGHSY